MNWIESAWAKPPLDMSVLLFVVTSHDEKFTSEWDSCFCIGYWSSVTKRYELEDPNRSPPNEAIENENVRVICWTLLPQITKKLKLLTKKEISRNDI